MASQPPRAASRLNYDASSQAIQQTQQNPVTAIVTQHKDFLEKRLAKIKEWVRHGVSPEALVRFTLREMSGNTSASAKLRECTPESIYLGLLACAVTGLEPGALKGEAYLVPFRDNKRGVTEATFMPGYRGIVKQAKRSREVVAIWSNVVFEGDEFEVDLGSGNKIVHRPRLDKRGDDVIAAYAIARMSSGADQIELMDRKDLDAVRKASGNKSPAWDAWPDQMYRKAPVRRLGKYLPMGPDYFVAMALDDANTTEDQRRIIDVEVTGEATRTEVAAGAAVEMAAQVHEDMSEADMLAHDAALNAREGNK